MRMFNGGIVSREPGGPFFVSSKPLTRSIGEDGSYEVINFYQTDYNMSLSAKAIMAGNMFLRPVIKEGLILQCQFIQ